MNLQHQLKEQLKVLHLGGFLQTLDLRLQQAQGSSLGYVEFLQLLVQPACRQAGMRSNVGKPKN